MRTFNPFLLVHWKINLYFCSGKKLVNHMIRLTTIIFLLLGVQIQAQQLSQYSLWLLNPYAYNPACAGLEPSLVANGVYRQQWIDLDGAPVTQQINVHLPLRFLSSGAGLRIENDAIGAHRTTQAMLSYNYQLNAGAGVLAIGGGVGYQQYLLDGSRIRTPQGDYRDQVFQHNDAFLPLGSISIGTPVMELGVSFSTDRILLGLSSQPVFSPVIKEKSPGQFQLQPERHYIFQGAYTWETSDNLVLKPGLLFKTDGVKMQAEVGAVGYWKDKFTAGLGYRGLTGATSRDAVIIMAGVGINDKTTLYYGYDVPLSGLKSTNRGSHEVMLRYNMNKPLGVGKNPPVIYNPRYVN